MNTKTKDVGIPQKLLTELEGAVANAANGNRDSETAIKACKEMDRMREELRKKVGTVDVSVDLVREARDAP